MSEWGAKISQKYKDVNTCDDKDLVFSTEWNTPKIVEKGEIILTVPSYSIGEKTIYHNYGWVGVLTYVNSNNNEYHFCDLNFFLGNVNYSFCKIKENSFTIEIYNNENKENTFNVSYFILIEKIE